MNKNFNITIYPGWTEPEVELNRERIYDKANGNEIVGEVNFVIPLNYFYSIFNDKFAAQYETVEIFWDAYVPEVEGEAIYQQAIADNMLFDEFATYYSTI